jgi:hypothetical protein
LLAIGLLALPPDAAGRRAFDGLDLRQSATWHRRCALRVSRPDDALPIHQIKDAARVCDRFV